MSTAQLEPKRKYLPLLQPLFKQALLYSHVGRKGLDQLLSRREEVVLELTGKLRELATVRQFADERTDSSHNYPARYHIKEIAEQIRILQEYFPTLDPRYSRKIALRGDSTRWFVIPRWQRIASCRHRALELLFGALRRQHHGKFFHEEITDYKAFALGEKTSTSLKVVADAQRKYDYLLLRAQFGIKYRGHSPNLALDMMDEDEFGLDVFSTGCMLLTHPERLKHHTDLQVDCSGEPYEIGGNQLIPYFFCVPGKGLTVRLAQKYRNFACCGTASGFLSVE